MAELAFFVFVGLSWLMLAWVAKRDQMKHYK